MSEFKMKRFIGINVPVTTCNLRCHYCYITQLKQWDAKLPNFQYDAKHVRKALSKKRLGGTALINLTGGGETLLPPEMILYIKELLEEGHYLEVVTNGTVTKRFEELEKLDRKLLERLEFKFSFHYLELKRLNKLDVFFNNIKMMREAGCSFTVEVTPTDELIPYIDELKETCNKNLGALCQMTIARADTKDDKRIWTNLSDEEYIETWSQFKSNMFDFKTQLLGKKRREFCYAGAWSLYVNLKNGDTKQCYGQLVNQNIFKNLDKPIKFEPVGHYCRQPYCYNGHAYLSVGCIPELKAPTYADIRNRKCENREMWFSDKGLLFFSSCLYDSNKEYGNVRKAVLTCLFPFKQIPLIIRNRKIIYGRLRNNDKTN